MKNELTNYRERRNLFDEAIDSFFKPTFFNLDESVMKTDIREDNNNYILDIEMPGYKKDNINISLEDGYVTVSAKKDEKVSDEGEGRYLRRERSVSCSRSYYVGDVEEKDVVAKFDNGVLTLLLPKEMEKERERKHSIKIQ